MRLTLISVVVSLGLTGCSSLAERQKANGGFDYIDKGQSISLEVPENLNQPDYRGDYRVPSTGDSSNDGQIGASVAVTAPALVLPLVSGSHIVDGKKEAIVSFDKVDDSQPLDTAIWNSLINYLEEQGIGVETFDKDNQRLVTDWVIYEEEMDKGWLSWNNSTKREGLRFEFLLDIKPHGRTATLTSKLVDYLETMDGDVIESERFDNQRRQAVDVLNKVIGHYAYQIRVTEAKRLAKIRKGFDSRMGFDRDGEPAFIVDAEYDIAWSRMLLILRKMGFDVQDLDKSNGLLFVRYRGADQGWWDSLWGSEDELPLTPADYRMEVLQAGAQTSVTIADNDNQPLAADLMSQIYGRFSNLMAEENLDI